MPAQRTITLMLALAFIAGATVTSGQTSPAPAPGMEPVVGLPCENCESVFEGLPASQDSEGHIAPAGERGERLLLRGGLGVTTPVRDARGVWQVTRDIRLGENIPGYSTCAKSPESNHAAM